MKILKKYLFLICLIVFFVAADAVVAHIFPRNIVNSGEFWLNDFELTQRDHPETVWDKVFFGNSTVYAAYNENESNSGYVDLGMDDAVLTDLWDMINKGNVKIGSDLVIGLNWLALDDDFETNPNYIWHKGVLEPYCYFQRDRLSKMIITDVKKLVLGQATASAYLDQTKTRYYSCLSDQKLAEKAADFTVRYWNASPDTFKNNYEALEKIIKYCSENNIRLRVVWMPWNPKVEKPDIVLEVRDTVNSICAENGVEVNDMMDSLDAECFSDVAHLNYEYGSHQFTEEIEKWLVS